MIKGHKNVQPPWTCIVGGGVHTYNMMHQVTHNMKKDIFNWGIRRPYVCSAVSGTLPASILFKILTPRFGSILLNSMWLDVCDPHLILTKSPHLEQVFSKNFSEFSCIHSSPNMFHLPLSCSSPHTVWVYLEFFGFVSYFFLHVRHGMLDILVFSIQTKSNHQTLNRIHLPTVWTEFVDGWVDFFQALIQLAACSRRQFFAFHLFTIIKSFYHQLHTIYF